MDLDGQPELPASIDLVSDTTRSTTLAKGNIKLHTVEHMLSTFSGMSLDNVVVELDANEPPIGDGSSVAFCELVRRAGLSLQAQDREPLKVVEPMALQMGDSIMSVFPHDGFKICYPVLMPEVISLNTIQRRSTLKPGNRTYPRHEPFAFLKKSNSSSRMV